MLARQVGAQVPFVRRELIRTIRPLALRPSGYSNTRAIEGIFAAIAKNILELSQHPADYPNEGVPPLHVHTLWSDFPHGVSIGGRSLIVYGRLVFSLARFNIWFRRFLMRMYMRRYRA